MRYILDYRHLIFLYDMNDDFKNKTAEVVFTLWKFVLIVI